MGKKFSKNYFVHYYETDCKLICKTSAMVNFICDVGSQHMESVGVGMKYCIDNNYTWVVYKYDIKIDRHPAVGEEILITTEVVMFKKFYAIRKYVFTDKNNNVIASAFAVHFLIDFKKRIPIRIQNEHYEAYGVTEEDKYDIKFPKLKIQSIDEENIKEFKVRHSDIDSNNHVNNVVYIDWALESVPQEISDFYDLREINVTFEKECIYGEKVVSIANVMQMDKDRFKICHKIRKEDGTVLTLLESIWENKN